VGQAGREVDEEEEEVRFRRRRRRLRLVMVMTALRMSAPMVRAMPAKPKMTSPSIHMLPQWFLSLTSRRTRSDDGRCLVKGKRMLANK